MKSFEYKRPSIVAEAVEILHQYGADGQLLAGGTDILIELRRPSALPTRAIIDINHLGELAGMSEVNGSLLLGPLTTHTELSKSDLLKTHARVLAMSAASIGSPQIRNRGTVGGNIMNAATCADTVPPLIALGATISLRSQSGTREIPLSDFFVKPYKTKASPDELLTSIRFGKLPEGSRSFFIKLGRRNALSISRLSVAAVVVQDGSGIITEARIVPGATLPTWQRIEEAEQMLIGEKPTPALLAAVGTKVAEVMISLTGRRWSTAYKEPVIGPLVRRALEECCV